MVESGSDTLHAAAFGTPEDAWAACAAISAETHVSYLDRSYRRVLSIMPTKYEDIWTAAKGFYKLEPIVADGGEVIIYAPHITQISVMHPQISEIGYHNRDYFLGQWDRFVDRPWGDLAHSTHLRGQGTWDAEHGERNRVAVTLATGIPREPSRRSTWATWIRRRSTSPRTRPIRTPSSSRTPARSSTGCGREGRRRRGRWSGVPVGGGDG